MELQAERTKKKEPLLNVTEDNNNNNNSQLEVELDRLTTGESSLFKSCKPYKENFFLLALMVLLVLGTGGLLGLVLLWYPRVRFWFRVKCEAKHATSFLIRSNSSIWTDCPVKQEFDIKFFEFQCTRFVWKGVEFVPYLANRRWTYHEILCSTSGLEGEYLSPMTYVETGRNIIEVPMMGLFEEILRTFLAPIQLYQYACCIVWYVHSYPFFGSMILGSVLVTTALVVKRDREARFRLKQMAIFSINVNVIRNGKWEMINSLELLPGDVLQIPADGFKSPCDLVLISGSTLVDESFMTGESVPVVKYQPDDDKEKFYDPEKDKNHSIYSGTTVLSASPVVGSPHVIAMASRTGYKTSKGQLIKSILYREPFTYEYERESFYWILFSFVVGTALFWVSLYVWKVFEIGIQTKEQILYGFESLLCLVPPFLPVIFNTSLLVSAGYLEEIEIYTTSPSRIPISGKVKTMCYDKTGTLTKTDLDVIGVVTPASIKRNTQEHTIKWTHIDQLEKEEDNIINCMATCHSLASVDDFNIIQLVNKPHFSGNSIDIKMFTSTGWTFHNASAEIPVPHAVSPSGETLKILKRFDFDPSLQRMSSVVQLSNGSICTFVKGSSEVIKECCDPSTLPPNFKHVVRYFSREGCYILALAYRPLNNKDQSTTSMEESEILDLNRLYLEKDLTFLGLLLMRNELKPDSVQAIYQMKQGRIRTVMITGDNIFTALYIAKESGIVENKAFCFAGEMKQVEGTLRPIFRDIDNRKRILDPFTWQVTDLTNKSIQQLKPSHVGLGIDADTFKFFNRNMEYRNLLVNHVNVFARMRPFDKQEAIMNIMKSVRLPDGTTIKGQVTGMIGDGANDCAALSIAHFGIALSEAEASLIAPFTAKSLSVMSAVELVKEGRACLVNAFASFKFTIFYSLAEMTAMFMAYFFGADLSQLEYTVLDFLFFFPVVFFMVRSKKSDRLRSSPPTFKIFGPTTIWSLLIPLIVLFTINGIALKLLTVQSWFKPHPIGTIAFYQIAETSTLFLVNCFFLGAASISWSFGSKYRQPIYKNIPLIVCYVMELFIIILVFVLPNRNVEFLNFMEMVYLPEDFLLVIAFLGVTGFFAIIMFEYVFIIGPVAKYCRGKCGKGREKPIKDSSITNY